MNVTQTIETQWTNIKNIIKETSGAIIGGQNRSKRKAWLNTMCEEALVRRNNARLT